MRILFLFFSISISTALTAQINDFWSSADENAIVLSTEDERGLVPDEYQTFALDLEAMKTYLQSAPMERTAAAQDQALTVEFPSPDGTVHEFLVVESPVMQSELAGRFPHIKSFSGYSKNNTGLNVRFVYSDHGFHGIFYSPNARYYIQPYSKDIQDTYVVYDRKDMHLPNDDTMVCGVSHDDVFSNSTNPVEGLEIDEDHSQGQASNRNAAVEVVDIREYRMAVAGLAEWTNTLHGGTVSGGLSAVNIMANVLNSFFQPELAVRFVLINENDQLIYTDPSTDPYNDIDNANNSLLGQNQDNLDATIGNSNYDIGHLLTLSCVGIGGVAALNSICNNNNKGAGLTCQYSSNLELIISEVAAHEVAHQFSATHSWNNCEGTIGSPPQDIISARSSGTAYEPGSGSTIMSYAGGCQSQNIQFGSDYYYHVASLEQMYTSVGTGNGSECANISPSSNNYPDLELEYEDGFYIPISTPFELTATGSDQDGDILTYCWEQYNLGPVSPLGNPTLNGPSFRSFLPVESPTRVFPRMQNVVQNIQQDVEVLPSYTRNLTFRCTARDNNPDVGGVVWEEMSFEATDQAGPFLVQYPNNNDIFEVGQYIEVLWDVANTDQAPVNCERVNIRYSSNGGYDSDIMLAENIPNDGAHFVTIPNVITGGGRVRVEAAENIFFDLSNFNHQIVEATTPGYTFDAGPYFQQVCVPDDVVINLSTLSLLGYDSLLNISISGLPTGANPIFSANPILPSEGGGVLTIETSNIVDEGFYDLEFTVIANEGDTIIRNVTFDLVLNDFSTISLESPANGSSGVAEVPTFTWVGSPNANSYDIEVANNPSFAPGTILDFATGLTTTTFTPSVVLEKNNLYFWRIRPQNECGYGDFSTPQGFHTEVFECAIFESNNVPLNISGIGTPIVESTLVVPSSGAINDLNIQKIKGSHDLVQHLDVSLIGPDDTEVLLFSDICGVATAFNMGLDDESPLDIQCPPNNGGTFKPHGNLSDFNNLDPVGTWTLKVAVNNTDGVGGALEEWSLQICSNASANAPYLVNNELMPSPPGGARQITEEFLLSEDDDNGPEDLTYTIVTAPQNGTLFFLGNQPLEVGMTFRQATINAGNLTYVHNGGAETTDGFTFAVEDGEGGWFGTPRFEIEIDPDVMIGTEDLENNNDFDLFPNPSQDLLNLRFVNPVDSKLDLFITNVQGQVLQSQTLDHFSEQTVINTSRLANGIYFIYVKDENAMIAKRFVVQR